MALPRKYFTEPVTGSLCATTSTQLTRIQRMNNTEIMVINSAAILNIIFFMITSFSFLETMLKYICELLRHGFHVLFHTRVGASVWIFYCQNQNAFSLSSFCAAFSNNSFFRFSANLFRTFTGGSPISFDIS